MSLLDSLGLGSARVIAICGAGGKSSLMFALADELADAGERVLMTATTKLAKHQVAGRWPGRMAADADAIAEIARSSCGTFVAYRDVDAAAGKVLGFAPEVVDQVARSGRFARVVVEADGSAHRPLKAPAAHEPVFPASADAVVMVAGASGLGRALDDDVVFRAAIWSRLTGIAAGEPVTPESLALMVVHPDGLARTAPKEAHRALFVNQVDDAPRLALALRTLAALARCAGEQPARAALGTLLPQVRILHQTRIS